MRHCCSFLTCILLSPPFPDNFPWPSISSTLLTRAEDDLSSWLFLLFSLYSRRFSPLMLFDSLISSPQRRLCPFPLSSIVAICDFPKGFACLSCFPLSRFPFYCVFHQLSFASHLDKIHKNSGKLSRHENFTYDLIFSPPGLGFFYTSPSSS